MQKLNRISTSSRNRSNDQEAENIVSNGAEIELHGNLTTLQEREQESQDLPTMFTGVISCTFAWSNKYAEMPKLPERSYLEDKEFVDNLDAAADLEGDHDMLPALPDRKYLEHGDVELETLFPPEVPERRYSDNLSSSSPPTSLSGICSENNVEHMVATMKRKPRPPHLEQVSLKLKHESPEKEVNNSEGQYASLCEATRDKHSLSPGQGGGSSGQYMPLCEATKKKPMSQGKIPLPSELQAQLSESQECPPHDKGSTDKEAEDVAHYGTQT